MSDARERLLNQTRFSPSGTSMNAQFSPDGRQWPMWSRARWRRRAEYFDIVIEDFSTGTRHVLDFAGVATAPRWAPDGKRLAFVGSGGGGGGGGNGTNSFSRI